MPKALVIRAAGTNCDTEMVRAFRLAGATCDLVHIDRLIADPGALNNYDLLGFPGGFSYGDDVASGRVFAVRLRERLYAPLQSAVDRGACIIGACNGFQVLVQVGLLPGWTPGGVVQASGPPFSVPPAPTVALTDNFHNRFIDQWVRVEPVSNSKCVWTSGWHRLPAGDDAGATADTMMLPIAHGEGRFVTASDHVMQELKANGQIALRYTDNVNGSTNAVAGICDPTGRVFGLMPHPERYLEWNRHPFFTSLPRDVAVGDTPGLRMFKNAVACVASRGA